MSTRGKPRQQLHHVAARVSLIRRRLCQPCCQRVQPPGPPPHAHHPDSVVRPLPPLDAVVASAHRVGHVISDMKAFPLRTQPGWRLARRPGSARLCRVRRSSARSAQRGDRLHVCRWWRKQDGAPCARGRASRWQLGLRTPSSETLLHRNAPLVLCLSMVSLCLGLFATSSLGSRGITHVIPLLGSEAISRPRRPLSHPWRTLEGRMANNHTDARTLSDDCLWLLAGSR